MSEVAKIRPIAETQERTLDPDVLAAVIDETARRVEARAARPSPIHLRSWAEIERFAEKAAKSGIVPKDYIGKPDAICIAVQYGSEIGLAPMQALLAVAVINGRPAIFGDAMIALCRHADVCGYIKEWQEGEGDNAIAWCEAKRKDDPNPIRRSFSKSDAVKAGLWGKSGPWAQYPARMLQMRARGFCLRDAFPDVLKGLISAEEARDIPWSDTGLPPVGAPPVATAAPIAPATKPATPPASSRREAINAEVPLNEPAPHKPRMTVQQWLTALETALRDAKTSEERERILAREEVRKARETLRNGALQRLNAILADAAPGPVDDFPGVVTPDEPPPLGEDPASLFDTVMERIATLDIIALQRLPTDARHVADVRQLDEAQQGEVETARVGRIQELRMGA